jgi:dolichol-phosphate mannosyltransferase
VSNFPTLSVLIPVYNEEEGIPSLLTYLDEVQALLQDAETELEVILVDDHSTDRTQELLRAACDGKANYHYLRLSLNRGTHIAIVAGMEHASGDCATFIAADLADPPDLLPKLVAEWRKGFHVVWAVRAQQQERALRDRWFSRLFFVLITAMSPVSFPPDGTDLALMDRRVVEALVKSVGAKPSLGVDIASLGFKQTLVKTEKLPRQHGTSKWTIRRRIEAFIDAFVSVSYVPIRIMSYVGITTSLLGFLYAGLLIFIRLFLSDNPIEGWTTLIVIVLIIGGIQMTMLGIIGEYMWRTLENARNRPLYNLEIGADD